MRSKIFIALLVIATLMLPCSICKAEALQFIGQGAVYNPLPDPSNNNALQAAKQINNISVNPGEVFSFYEYVLPSIENGYQEGLTMYQTSRGTELLPDIGGGICKAATALNFAVQNAGLEVVEVHQHSSPVSYAAPGQDAAVSRSAGWDYRFRNTLDKPVLITGGQEEEYLIIKLYVQNNEEQIKTNPTFPDQNLERAVRDTLDKPSGELLPEDLLSIKELYLYRKNISSIEGLEKLKNLEILEASGNNIVDISPVSGLRKLHTLCLGANQISDIESLEKLVNLECLELFNNSISNIEALTDLQLKKLYLDNNQISDISCLKNLSGIKVLSLSGNNISRISSLESIRKAQYINLANNQITNIRFLRSVMEYNKDLDLDLRGNAITEAPVVKRDRNVSIKLDRDIAEPKGEIQKEYGYEVNIADKNLKEIISKKVGKSELTVFDVNDIEVLDARNSEIKSLQGIEKLSGLKELYLDNNCIEDIEPLRDLFNLEVITLTNNDIQDISALSYMLKPSKILLQGNLIKDFAPLQRYLKVIKEKDFVPVSPVPQEYGVNVFDGSYYVFDESPYIENNKTLAPVRMLEYWGFELSWDNESRVAEAVKDGLSIKLQADNKEAFLNGQLIMLDVPAKIKNERMFIPARFIFESLNMNVDWDPETKTVIITGE